MPDKNSPVPIFITLIGNTAVGKSYYLLSLGLALKQYPKSLRDKWDIIGLSEVYKKQLKQWKRDHQGYGTIQTTNPDVNLQEYGVIGATNSGTNIQLSFDVENKKSNRRYRVILADMAGEDIVRYLNNEKIVRRLANDIKMRIRLSSGILLMMDSQPFDDEQFSFDAKELDAWEELLKTELFNSFGICLMKADILEPVKEKLRPQQEEMERDPSGYALNPSLFDDKSMEEHAQNEFDKSKTKEISHLLNGQRIKPGFHYVSSTGVYKDGVPPELNEHIGQFIGYNILKPVLDTLEAVEADFKEGLWSDFRGFLKNRKWSSKFKEADKLYKSDKFISAINIFFNKELHRDSREYYSVFSKFGHTLGEIHRSWIQERIDYESRLPAKDRDSLLNNMLKSLVDWEREVIDDDELHVEKETYCRKLRGYFQENLPDAAEFGFDFHPSIELLHEQCHELRQAHGETKDLENFILKLIIREANEISQNLSIKDEIGEDLNELRDTVLSQSRALSLHLGIWKLEFWNTVDLKKWLSEVESKLGSSSVIGDNLKHLVNIVYKKAERRAQFSTAFRYLKILEDACDGKKELYGVSDKFFKEKNRRLNKLRIKVFKKIPSLRYLNKKYPNFWYCSDEIAETLYNEWELWKEDNSRFPIPQKLKYFPESLFTCPQCGGKKNIKKQCPKCGHKNWLVRLFINCEDCKGTGKLKHTCPHCSGRGKRRFVS